MQRSNTFSCVFLTGCCLKLWIHQEIKINIYMICITLFISQLFAWMDGPVQWIMGPDSHSVCYAKGGNRRSTEAAWRSDLQNRKQLKTGQRKAQACKQGDVHTEQKHSGTQWQSKSKGHNKSTSQRAESDSCSLFRRTNEAPLIL